MNPNDEFHKRKKYSSDQYGSPRPKRNTLMIRCDATNCGHKMIISMDLWRSEDWIECPNCGADSWWSAL